MTWFRITGKLRKCSDKAVSEVVPLVLGALSSVISRAAKEGRRNGVEERGEDLVFYERGRQRARGISLEGVEDWRKSMRWNHLSIKRGNHAGI